MSEIEDQLRVQFGRQVERPDPNASVRLAQVRSRAVARTRNRRAAVGATAAALVLLVGMGLVGPLKSESGPGTTSAAQDRQDVAPGGDSVAASGWVVLDRPIRLMDFVGLAHLTKIPSPVEVVNVWAEWCGPCVDDLPTLQAASDRGEVDVRGVSIDTDDTAPTTTRRILQAAGVTYPNLEDTTGENEAVLSAKFGTLGYPLTLGVEDGLIFAVHSGRFDSVAGVEYAAVLAETVQPNMERVTLDVSDCQIAQVVMDGRTWVTDRDSIDYGGTLPRSGFPQHGDFIVLDENRARFVADTGASANFVPAADSPGPSSCD